MLQIGHQERVKWMKPQTKPSLQAGGLFYVGSHNGMLSDIKRMKYFLDKLKMYVYTFNP